MDWEGLRWDGGPPFYVWRAGPFDWHVRHGWEFGSEWVASFWWRGEAEATAGRLNRIAGKHGWSNVGREL
jgi:hypothetical protein